MDSLPPLLIPVKADDLAEDRSPAVDPMAKCAAACAKTIETINRWLAEGTGTSIALVHYKEFQDPLFGVVKQPLNDQGYTIESVDDYTIVIKK